MILCHEDREWAAHISKNRRDLNDWKTSTNVGLGGRGLLKTRPASTEGKR